MEPDEFDAELAELETRLERLRSLYEQYFLGIERIEPSVARKDVDRRFWQIRRVKVRNTARRFKLQTLLQRYTTLQQHWGKICRQIEAGTYVRHLAKARRREEQFKAQRPKTVQPPAPDVSSARPTRKADKDDFQRRIEKLHADLSRAQERLSPGTKPVSVKALAESLRMTEAKLRHKYAGKKVDFEVVVQDNRAAIRPIIRKR